MKSFKTHTHTDSCYGIIMVWQWEVVNLVESKVGSLYLMQQSFSYFFW